MLSGAPTFTASGVGVSFLENTYCTSLRPVVRKLFRCDHKPLVKMLTMFQFLV
jgi:hypothetical protein